MKLRVKNDIINYSLINSSDSLFHFTSRNVALENILFENKFLLCNLSRTKDPQEYKKQFMAVSYQSDSDTEDPKVYGATSLVMQYISKYSYVLCTCKNIFSDSGDLHSSGYLKSRMWSQYGESQQGVCLVFSKKSLTEEIETRLGASKFLFFHNNIEYSYKLEKATNIFDADSELIDGIDINEYSFKYISKNNKQIFFVKQVYYKDEDEYRFIVIDKVGTEINPLEIGIKKCLKGVILGDRFPRVYHHTIKWLSEKSGIPYFHLMWYGGQFLLEPVL